MGVSASTGKSPGLGKSLAYYAPDKAPTSYWNPEPRVILSNDSDYIVSYWVVEEDKKRTSERQHKISRSIGLQLNASSNHNTNNNNNSNNKTDTAAGTSSSEVHPEKTQQQQQEETLGTEEQEQDVGDGVETGNNNAGGPTSSEYIKKIHNQGKTPLETGEEEEEDEVYYLTRDHRMGRKGSTQPTQVPFPADCQHMRVYGCFEKDGEWQCFKDQVYSIALINKNFRITASTSNDTPCSDKKTSRLPKRLLLGRKATA